MEVLVGVSHLSPAVHEKVHQYVSRGDRNIIAADIRVKRLMNNTHTVASDPDVCIYGKEIESRTESLNIRPVR